ASPFDPRPPPTGVLGLRVPYFIGWFLRGVDHDQDRSFGVVIGSFRHPNRVSPSKEYNQHYLSLAYSDAKGSGGGNDAVETHTFHSLPAADAVKITGPGGGPVQAQPDAADPDFSWEVARLGSLHVDGDGGELSFELPELRLAAKFSDRLPWDCRYPNTAGPEGILARTRLLPLHYFVHSFGSRCVYELKPKGGRAVAGTAVLHMEANYGNSFPTGWVWAQGCSDGESDSSDGASSSGGGASEKTAGSSSSSSGDGVANDGGDGRAHFVLTGGKFLIGPFTTDSFILGYRSPGLHWDFRTTELDRVRTTFSHARRFLRAEATSRRGERHLELEIRAPEGSFGNPIYVPTPLGFSNRPGCIESYTATATFRCYESDDEGG
ncbi:unnamed protein product, partial [Phaeothamnion confervicola]